MRYSNRNAKALAVLSAAAGFAASVQLASAQTWVAPNTGGWASGANWVGGVAPVSGASTALTFNATGAQTYTATNDIGVFQLAQVTSNNTSTGAINIAGAALNPGGATISFAKSGSGALNVSNNFAGGGAGFVNVSGTNVNLSGGGNLASLGSSGPSSSFSITGGTWTMTSQLRRNDALVGANTGPWGLNLGETDGSTTTFNHTGGTISGSQGFINVGYQSTGVWNLSGASTAATFGFQDANAGPGRFGILTGNGTLNVTGGALLGGRLFEVGRHSVGAEGGGGTDINVNAFVSVTGANSRILAHQLVNRAQGNATINVNTGGLIDLTAVDATGSTGAGLMVLGGAAQGATNEPVGSVAVMNIGAGGIVRAIQPQIGSELGVSTINITGGGQFLANPSPSPTTLGEAIFMGDADALGDPGDTATGFGAINVDGANSTLNNTTPSGAVIVMGGGGGAATGGDALLTVSNGGNVTSNDLTIGQDEGSNGTVTVSGATSTVNLLPNGAGTVASIVMAGNTNSTGVLNINGGTVSTGNTFIGGGFADALGDPVPGGVATVNMAAGSRLNVSAQWTMASVPGGQGVLNNNGGTVLNSGNAFLSPTDAPDPTAFSIMNINGGTFATSGQLQAGGAGGSLGSVSTVNITNNGFVGTTSAGTLGSIIVYGDGAAGNSTINIGSGTSKGTMRAGGDTLIDGVINFNAGTMTTVGTLDVAGSVILSSAARNGAGTPSNKKFVETGQATLTASGVIDLNDNDMLIHDTTAGALQKYENFIRTARNNGLWNQPGITSTAAKNSVPKNKNLGAISGANFQSANGGAGALFNGRTVAGTDTLIKFTFNGDTDLNGVVNFDDYARTDSGFNNNRSGWFNGDFDYNGIVNFDDYSLIDQSFNTQGGVILASGEQSPAGPGWDRPLISTIEGKSDIAGLMADKNFLAQKHEMTGSAGNLTAVPEPSTLGVVGVAMLGALARRRRTH